MKNFFVMIFMLLFIILTMIPSGVFAFPGSPYPAIALEEVAIGPLISMAAVQGKIAQENAMTTMPFSSNYAYVDSGGGYALGCMVADGILCPVVAEVSVVAAAIPDSYKSTCVY